VTPLQLDVDVTPGGTYPIPATNEPVVQDNHKISQRENND
jgi:hypothetical protein